MKEEERKRSYEEECKGMEEEEVVNLRWCDEEMFKRTKKEKKDWEENVQGKRRKRGREGDKRREDM